MPRDLPKGFFAAILIASLLNISTFVLRHVDADIWLYLVRMDCFSQGFWNGAVYPRWCFSANGGLGSPVFIFYFPLSFYIAALFYPLTHLGLSMYGLFVLLCFLATLLTAVTSYAWLRDIVRPGYALLASILLLFMPYRLEMLFFRGAYAEIWCLAFLPLAFKYTRRLALGEKQAALGLSVTTAALLLMHVPAALSGLLFAGLYIMIATAKALRPKLMFAACMLWGTAAAAFYLSPAQYYQQFLTQDKLTSGVYGWANGFLTLAYLHIPGLERPAMAAILMALLLVEVVIGVMLRKSRIEDAYIRKEIMIWGVISVAALFLLLPASAPFYALMGPLSHVLFPWRMQNVLTLAAAYMLAVRMQWLMAPGRELTWKSDYILVIIFLMGVGHMLVASYGPQGQALNERLAAQQIIFAREFRTQWMDDDHWDYPYLLEQHDKHNQPVTIVSGEGQALVNKWSWSGVAIETHSLQKMTLRLEHNYFPVWHAALENGTALTIKPEDKTGRMLLETPPGDHVVTLTCDLTQDIALLAMAKYCSALAFMGMFCQFMRQKYFDNTRGRC